MHVIEDNTIPPINIEVAEIYGKDRVELFTNFLNNCDELGQYRYNNMIFIAMWFDSTISYQHMYYSKTKDGMIHNHYNDGYPTISIECSEKLVINYIKTKCFYDTYTSIDNDILNNIIAMYCKTFKYNEAIIFFEYKNFTEFKDNYKDNIEYLSVNLYCHTIYDYIKNKNKNSMKYYSFIYGFWKIDKIIIELVPINIINKLPSAINTLDLTWGDMFLLIVEKYFYLYNNMEDWFNTHHDNLFKNNFYTFDVNSYLKTLGYNIKHISNFKHINMRERDGIFRLISNDAGRRIE